MDYSGCRVERKRRSVEKEGRLAGLKNFSRPFVRIQAIDAINCLSPDPLGAGHLLDIKRRSYSIQTRS